MVLWAGEIEKRRGKKIAVVALAGKMAGILYAIWQDGSIYDPRRGASQTNSLSSDAATVATILKKAASRRA